MIKRFFRSFFWALLLGFVVTWVYLGIINASTREAILIEDRTLGLTEQPVLPGEWGFVPARIVPNRINLHRVYLGPRILNLKYSHGLSQGEMLDLDDSYSIQLHLRLEYKLDPEYLKMLFLELDKPNFNRLQAYLTFRLQIILDRFIKKNYKQDADIPDLESIIQKWLTDGTGLARFNSELQYVGVSIERNIPIKVYIPNFTRYKAMLKLGKRTLLELKLDRIRKINQARTLADTRHISDQADFSRLKQMGGLLQRYPNLKEYVSLQLMGDKVQVMIVPSDKWMGGNSRNTVNRSIQKFIKPKEPLKNSGTQTKFNQFTNKPLSTNKLTASGNGNQFLDLTPP